METRERCPVCDRPMASHEQGRSYLDQIREQQLWNADPPPADGNCYAKYCGCVECSNLRVNWRTRALAAEARIREAVDVLDGGQQAARACADSYALLNLRFQQRQQVIAILTRNDTNPTNPEVTP